MDCCIWLDQKLIILIMKREERDASLGGEEARMAAAENSHKI
jgi:hypothetical protein